MEYLKAFLEYIGIIKKPRETSIGRALPHENPASREEALTNLVYASRCLFEHLLSLMTVSVT